MKIESNIKEQIASLGKKIDSFKKPSNPLEMLMITIGQQITSQLKQALSESGIELSSNLSQSIAPNVVTNGSNIELTITAEEYWEFVNSGVNGVFQNVGGAFSFKTDKPNKKMATSIQGWMSRKGIANAQTFKSISYAIATKVKQEGINPTHFVDKVMSVDFINSISESLSNEMEKQIILNIR